MTNTRVPRSGNAALAAGALIQLALGIEFVLAGVNKLLDPEFATQFEPFVAASPAASSGVLAPLLRGLVLPHPVASALLVTFAELGAGLVLVVSAVEGARRRPPRRLRSPHGHETT